MDSERAWRTTSDSSDPPPGEPMVSAIGLAHRRINAERRKNVTRGLTPRGSPG
jgi:hypothetical protein